VYEPQSGTISIDGRDIRSIKLASLRRSIGVIFQEPLLIDRREFASRHTSALRSVVSLRAVLILAGAGNVPERRVEFAIHLLRVRFVTRERVIVAHGPDIRGVRGISPL
jgi:ABC-type ATPase involved in cell division